jgi:Zn-finger nucleic acid-binding protein
MNCPRCLTQTLVERERDDVTIDICPSCRGVWLDRGELERLISRATSEIDELERHSGRRDDRDERSDWEPRLDRDDARRDHDHRPHHGKRKRRWFESLGDIFD